MPGTALDERISSRLSQIMGVLRLPSGSGWMLACRRSARPAANRSVTAAGLCAACWSKLSPIERPFCEKLGIPFTYDPGPGIYSMQAIADPPAYARARAAVRYDEIARSMVHALKYGDRLDLAPVMARWMARAGGDCLRTRISWCRFRCIGGGSGRAGSTSRRRLPSCLPHAQRPVSFTALKRVKATPQQVGLSKSERAANVQGAFRVEPAGRAEIARRHVVLVDDVLTSGATADACSRVLLRAGPAKWMSLFSRGLSTAYARPYSGIR